MTFLLIVEIKRNALDDGPGIRTVIFFKGCPLACVWCQNPEAISPFRQIMYSPGDCLGCRTCEKTCPQGAIKIPTPPTRGRRDLLASAVGPGVDPINRELCQACGLCAENCPSSGLRPLGRYYSVDQLVAEVMRDEPFYRNSGGGVTLSGGEATLHPRYLGAFLPRLKERGIHVILETCGYYHRPSFEQHLLPYLDLIYFDLKLIDSEEHKKYTGRANRIILDNFQALLASGAVPVLPRIPLIPGITTSENNLAGLAAFLRRLGVAKVALLPYNPLWVTKADNLGRPTPYRHSSWMTEEERAKCARFFDGIEVV
ncbi:MAG: glycyl-radical enzyme activating protein [Firmicutes bacterium]|nr:glycyl-radical enzyme activating protein [Bacillota bacterium]MCL5040733.1 glycyl-radical enzyme activating protein [Bacillota bacterium]